MTALLHSRTADVAVGNEQKSPEVRPLKPVVLHSRKEAALDTPVKENGIWSQVVSTPVVSSTVGNLCPYLFSSGFLSYKCYLI